MVGKIREIDEVTRARMLKKMAERRTIIMEHEEVAPQRFLEAWKKGVAIIGESYFKNNPSFLADHSVEPAASLKEVTHKWQVSPDYDFILEHIGVLSGGEAALLAAMCSVYNSEWGGDLMREIGLNGMSDVSAKLEIEERQIVADLLLYYAGW